MLLAKPLPTQPNPNPNPPIRAPAVVEAAASQLSPLRKPQAAALAAAALGGLGFLTFNFHTTLQFIGVVSSGAGGGGRPALRCAVPAHPFPLIRMGPPPCTHTHTLTHTHTHFPPINTPHLPPGPPPRPPLAAGPGADPGEPRSHLRLPPGRTGRPVLPIQRRRRPGHHAAQGRAGAAGARLLLGAAAAAGGEERGVRGCGMRLGQVV